MNGAPSVWRQRLWFWLVPLAFFVVNFGLWSMYQAGYAGRVDQLEERLQDDEEVLKQRQNERREIEALLEQIQANREAMRSLYQERLSTRRQNLIAVTREVKRLARQAGLEPGSVNYPQEEIEGYRLVKLSFVFGVTGDYQSLRSLINFLELSESFLVLERIVVNEVRGESNRLSINLHISTLFAKERLGGSTVSQTTTEKTNT